MVQEMAVIKKIGQNGWHVEYHLGRGPWVQETIRLELRVVAV